MAKYKTIKLSAPEKKGGVSLKEAISKRRSHRSFSNKDLNWQQISQILWAAQGITGRGFGLSLRSVPSAGALYPMEIYLLTKEGLFHYLPSSHEVEVIIEKDLREDLSSSALGQKAVAQAPVDIVICAVYERTIEKYGKRGEKYVHMEAGHVAQNIHLQTVGLGLVSVPIGAFDNQRVKAALSLPQKQEPLYIIPLGYAD